MDDRLPVFLHMHKTGGTSVIKALGELFPGRTLSERDRAGALVRRKQPVAGKGLVVAGHFDLQVANSMPSPRYLMTVFREPTERLLSHLYFIKQYEIENLKTYHRNILLKIKTNGIGELIRDPEIIATYGNYYTGMLVAPAARPSDPDALYAEAERNLGCFDLIGLTHHLGGFIERLRADFGIAGDNALPWVNSRREIREFEGFEPAARQPLTSADLDQIEAINAIDRRLYNFVLANHTI